VRNKTSTAIWQHFIKALPLTIFAMLITAVGVLAVTGTLDSPADPDSTLSFSLEDVYQRLTSGAAGSKRSFTEPAVAPGTGTMHTINDIMAAAPEQDDDTGAIASDVAPGKTFWGLTDGEWGLQTGTMPVGSDVLGEDGSLTFNIPDACYSGNTATARDADLLAENIKSGVEIFGVTGAVPEGADVTGGEGELSFAIPEGCYAGNTATARDGDLLAGNIKSGVDLFGVTGTYTTGWKLQTTVAERIRFRDVDFINSSEGWAVGDDGYIYHWDGTTWQIDFYIPDYYGFFAVEMISDTDGWVGGYYGQIYHWDGLSWSLHTTTAEGASIFDVEMVSSADGWAVGGEGRFYRWDGTAWSLEYTAESDSRIYAVDMIDGSSGWAVGNNRRFYHWDGSDWSLHSTGSAGTALYGVAMINETDGWAVGVWKCTYHWDGSTWTPYNDVLEPVSLYDVDFVSSSDVWAVASGGQIYHWNGYEWYLHHVTDEAASIQALDILNAKEFWAVGSTGQIYLYD
jgi:hypothetical protein